MKMQDEGRPICSRCKKGHFVCERYEGTIFVNVMSQKTKNRDSVTKNTPQTRSTDLIRTTLTRPRDDAVATRFLTAVEGQAFHYVQSSACMLTSPSHSSMWDEVFVLNMINKTCQGPVGLVYRQFLPLDLSSSHCQHTMVSHCLLATAKIFYGLKTREARVLRSGIDLYGQGLRMISNALNKSPGFVSTETIVSVVSLCIGEVSLFFCSGLRFFQLFLTRRRA